MLYWDYVHINVYTQSCVHVYCYCLICTSYTHPFSDNWSAELSEVDVSPFVQPVDPSNILPPTVRGIFQLFFTSTLVAAIVEQTNIYTRQVLGDVAESKWTDVTPDDIWAFFGFAILMGINRLPQLQQYWSTIPEFHYRLVTERISRNRFMEIWRFLHFVDNSTHTSSSPPDPNRDCLWKIRSMIIGSCGCLPHQLPASSGAGYWWGNGWIQGKVFNETVPPDEAGKTWL